MGMTILDFGSGGTCLNDASVIENMIYQLSGVDKDRKCIIKWQLWDKRTEPQCSRLRWRVFDYAFKLARLRGFRTTASVFDKPSLDHLLTYDIPFVKIANRPYLRHLARYVPRGIPIIASRDPGEPIDSFYADKVDRWMVCVSKYPAHIDDYVGSERPLGGISDHTEGLELWRRERPNIWEKHFKLEGQKGPDCGPWCITPSKLTEVLSYGR